MPELPDLEVISKNLNKKIAHQKLINIELLVDRKSNASEQELQHALTGKVLNQIFRTGKELHFSFSEGVTLGLHLMLHGEIKIADKDDQVKHTILKLTFPSSSLVLTDWQKQATPTLNPEPSSVPDALDQSFNRQYLMTALAKKKGEIKSVLMDQKFVRGIGNAYADEILYKASISPMSIAIKLDEPAITSLHNSIIEVLNNAISSITSADPDRISGENREFMEVHRPKTKNTKKGEQILINEKGGRKSYYVESQRSYT
ncbi:DNA-formamidopyrimidine glycosylase family protein [Pedobacter frigidisoli]|uniref:DNA-formamidopyrimidine glycosylase family protein n=1 Tax=Pedobacter frigidisoli TaxID=2530455 RepID=UPI002930D5D5|nr:DNA-formamidopyrimidine glycosylase family protein [Pedobacter frigidisoli]